MKNSLKLVLAAAALIVGVGLSAANAKVLDVVLDSNGNPIHTASGDCLRANQEGGKSACPGGAYDVARDTESVYFVFGQSGLTKEGKKTLDALVAKVKAKGGSVLGIRIAGFADRIGNAAANEKLSKKRADKVRRYLLSKGVANAQVVETRWFGDSVAATQCPKGLSKAKLIKCLQPDRRVDIEIDFAPVAE